MLIHVVTNHHSKGFGMNFTWASSTPFVFHRLLIAGTFQQPDGRCKTAKDYEKEINIMRSWSNPSHFKKFEVLKIFSTSECDALGELIPVLLHLGFTVWPVVWVHDLNKYGYPSFISSCVVSLINSQYMEGVGG